jgi:glycosyltransferase involved in cell wall biosynthesis
MKVSIITPCFNSENTIKFTLNSVISQTYKNIEHIIVDGQSSDGTKRIINEYPNIKKKIIYKKSNIYEAINVGIKNSSGEIIAILNSDDIYESKNTIRDVVKVIKKSNKKYKIFLGDVVFFKKNNFTNLSRFYSSNNFKIRLLKYGLMPPHPSSFVKKEVYSKIGAYNKKYKIAGDFDWFLKALLINKIPYKIINKLIVRMRVGGVSGRNILAYFLTTSEIIHSLKINKIKSNIIYVLARIPVKIKQFFFFNKKKINSLYNEYFHVHYKKLFQYDLIIKNKIEEFKFNNNFILSALNLAFLGSYIKGDIKDPKKFVYWPDGLFSKKFSLNLNKIPGRELLRKIKLHREITRIVVIGNLTLKSRMFLENLYRAKILNIKLPYGSIDKICKYIENKIILKKNDLTFITLPTPKQEQLAIFLSKKNKQFKIICIGGSIAIASGEETSVPKYIAYLEFLWRLRYETLRRVQRLVITFSYFCIGFFSNKISNLRVKIE